MQNIAIVGASGVVGSRALERLLDDRRTGQVTAVGRRPLPQHHPKLRSKVIPLEESAAIASVLPDGLDTAVCCLGTTMKQAGSKPAFRAVDHDAVLTFAEATFRRGAQRFILVSSLGANPRSRNFYLKTKGETEEALQRLGFAQLSILRPSFIDDQGSRSEHRLAERLTLPVARAVFSVLGKRSRYAPVTSEALGEAVVNLTFDASTERLRILESDQLHGSGT